MSTQVAPPEPHDLPIAWHPTGFTVVVRRRELGNALPFGLAALMLAGIAVFGVLPEAVATVVAFSLMAGLPVAFLFFVGLAFRGFLMQDQDPLRVERGTLSWRGQQWALSELAEVGWQQGALLARYTDGQVDRIPSR